MEISSKDSLCLGMKISFLNRGHCGLKIHVLLADSVNIFSVKNQEATIVGFEFHKTLKTKC